MIAILRFINTSTGWTVYDAVVWLIMTGAAEPGVHRVQVHPHILPGKEAKPVPSQDLVLIYAPPDLQTFRRPCINKCHFDIIIKS